VIKSKGSRVLKTRVITAIVLVALLIGALFFLPFGYFSLVAGLFFAIAAWEWSRLANFQGVWRCLYTLVFVALMIAVGWWAGLTASMEATSTLNTTRVEWIVALAVGWWIVAVFLVKAYPRGVNLWSSRVVETLMGLLVIIPTWIGLVYLHGTERGSWVILILIFSVVCADTGAYFVGRRWGKNKLAPNVSPGKSLEGFYGGFGCSTVFALILMFALDRGAEDWWLLALIVPASLASVLGDLLESMLKRNRGIKDSGIILPGHGGVLDRVDSMTAATPVFTLILILTGWHL